MLVVGTAGHVDHGKSALVEALTGIDPDRLKEEKEREMTIDLGFAWLTLPSGRTVSIIDVPGHEDFIKNMLAGVGGIDAALLLVAADEGVMPQTREHLAILDLLRIGAGLVALSKVDQVEDREWLELVQEEIAEELVGTALEGAPIVPVSAKTGEGLDVLLKVLDQALAGVVPREDLGRPRLGIDRVFTISGFGTVVTGTLVDGNLTVGQEVEVLPQGVRARIRGLQMHKRRVERAEPGSRVAINLAGVEKKVLRRGDLVTIPGWLRATRVLDARVKMLSDSPHPLAHNVEVDFFTGASQFGARTRLLDQEEIPPGEEGWVQLLLAGPIAVVRGDRFILRQPSPSLTIGGGVVVDAHPPRRHRRFHPRVMECLETLASGEPKKVLLSILREQEPCQVGELARLSEFPPKVFPQVLAQAIEGGQVLVLGADDSPAGVLMEGQYVLSQEGWRKQVQELEAILAAYHEHYALRAGMPRQELKSRLGHSTRLFNNVVRQAMKEGLLVEEGENLRLPFHEVAFSPAEEKRVAELVAAFHGSPYSTPSWMEAEAMVGRPILEALIQRGELVRLSDSVLYLAETYREMVDRVLAQVREEGSITVAQVRDLFGTSRKYALALMEHLDRERLTRRVGDERVLA